MSVEGGEGVESVNMEDGSQAAAYFHLVRHGCDGVLIGCRVQLESKGKLLIVMAVL